MNPSFCFFLQACPAACCGPWPWYNSRSVIAREKSATYYPRALVSHTVKRMYVYKCAFVTNVAQACQTRPLHYSPAIGVGRQIESLPCLDPTTMASIAVCNYD